MSNVESTKYRCRPCGYVYDPEKGAASRWMFEKVE